MKTRGRWKRHQGGRIHGIWQEMSWSRGGGGEMETAEAMPRISGEWLRRCSYHEKPVGGSRGWKGLRWTGGRLQPSVWGFLTAKCWDALQTQKREEHLGGQQPAKRSRCQRRYEPGWGSGRWGWPLSSELSGISAGLSGDSGSGSSQLPDGALTVSPPCLVPLGLCLGITLGPFSSHASVYARNQAAVVNPEVATSRASEALVFKTIVPAWLRCRAVCRLHAFCLCILRDWSPLNPVLIDRKPE